jgi:uncharacterized protein YuzE
MKVTYYPDTDSLYIDLSEQASADSREISEGVVLDYDESGNLVGLRTQRRRRVVFRGSSSPGTGGLPLPARLST